MPDYSEKQEINYLKNDIAYRKGYAGSYSGNHPKFSQGISMMGDPNAMGQADSVMGQGPMGQAQADLAYNPVDDISGQGTEGITAPMAMKGNSPFQNARNVMSGKLRG